MKIYMVLAIALLTLQAPAQSDCKWIENGEDEFTGHIVRQTQYKVVASGWNWNWMAGFKQVQDQTILWMAENEYREDKASIYSVSEGSYLYLKLSNDSVLTLPCLESSVSDNRNHIKIPYKLLPEQLSALATVPVVKFRLYSNDGYIEREFNNKGQARLMELARCMIQD